MTAEIAIINKLGVALAADSAVTISTESGTKIYNSVSKVFTLSKFEPVGIMIFGNSEFMTLPWELIIKLYRKKLGQSRFATLNAYVDDFIKFLRTNKALFTVDIQQAEYYQLAVFVLAAIKRRIEATVESHIAEHGSIAEDEVEGIVDEASKEIRDSVRGEEACPPITIEDAASVARKFRTVLRRATSDVLEELPISPRARRLINEIGALILHKDLGMDGWSGVVIAGYGEDDHFPSLVAHEFRWVIDGHLSFERTQKTQVGYGHSSAAIVPFAQREMVDTFMEGIAPTYRRAIEDLLDVIVERVPELTVAASNVPLPAETRQQLVRDLQGKGREIADRFVRGFDNLMDQAFVRPVVRVVNALPKDELAAMAEALVNLTSFKRKMSLEEETVGGPIDVAVISKGDGFVWIKRKHYFKPELNPHFFSNYFRSETEGGPGDGE